MSEMLCRPCFSPMILLLRYQMALVVESGCFEWVCLGLQPSHLLLIRTNLDCGTVLTAACARQGCSATHYYYYYYCYYYYYKSNCA
jgi:hypothetical protein